MRSQFVSALDRLTNEDEQSTSTMAACALHQIVPDSATAMSRLRRALDGDNDFLASIAAAELLDDSGHRDISVQTIQERMHRLNEVDAYQVVVTLRRVGTYCESVFEVVAALLAKVELHPTLRQAAAVTLGAMKSPSEKLVPPLLRAMASTDWTVIDGALEGFRRAGSVPEDVCERLVGLLSDPDKNMRKAAARGLQGMKEGCQPALKDVVQRLRDERDFEIASELALVVAGSGSTAIPTLIQVIRECDLRTIEAATRALMRMGQRAAVEIVDQYAHVPEPMARRAMIGALLGIGSYSPRALELLAQILAETEDDEMATYVAMGFCAARSNAAPAIPVLVTCIMAGRPKEVLRWIEGAIEAIGPDAIDALRQAVTTSNGVSKQRLLETLARLSAVDDGRFKEFEEFNEDETLEMFVRIADLMGKNGRIGYRRMEKIFEKEWQTVRFPISATRLGKGVARLEKVFRVQLIDRSEGKQRGLGRDASEFVARIQDYLRIKQQRLGA